MKRTTVGIVDYGIGNHASVRHTLRELEFRCRVTPDPTVLEGCDLLLLPGVGAFRPAMEALRARSLDRFVIDWANRERPVLGICLGMQLLTQSSAEGGHTGGLGLIPGHIVQLEDQRWHIGWNTVERVASSTDDRLFRSSFGQAFYFNHSYAYQGPQAFQIAATSVNHMERSFASAIRRGRIAGVQFHPEKSQASGRDLLRRLVEGLGDA